jgi:hypothetical protein
MYDRFTDRARTVMREASEEAQRLQSSHIGTEHLLLGMILEGGGVAAQVLKNRSVDRDRFAREVAEITAAGDKLQHTGKIPFTPRCKDALDKAESEAERLRHEYIGTEHLLLGLILEDEGVAVQALGNMGHETQGILLEVLDLIGEEGPAKPEPLLNLDQLALMRHAMEAGLRSVPVYSRAFGLTLEEVEGVMGQIVMGVAPSTPPAGEPGLERLGLSIKVGAGSGQISGIKREMAVLANRLGVTVHSELNDELCMACPGEKTARVYMTRKPDDPTPTPEPKNRWETVYSADGEILERFPTPVGWIYRSTQWIPGDEHESSTERTESMIEVRA